MSVHRFIAAYDSKCPSCPNAVCDGEEAGYRDDEVVCGECCDDEDARTDDN